MFLENKYTATYFKIIEKAKSEGRKKKDGTYYESHHIIPKSLGGSNFKDNLVLLTAKEHFVCHHLLIKMVGSKLHIEKMKRAFGAMRMSNSKDSPPLTPIQYEILRKVHSEHMLEIGRDKERNKIIGEKSSRTKKAKFASGETVIWSKGKKIGPRSEEVKDQMRKARGPWTEEKSEAQSKRQLEYWKDKEHPSKGITGPDHFNYGKIASEEDKEKQRIAQSKVERKECEFCFKFFHPGPYKKYHGAKCKLNPDPTVVRPYYGIKGREVKQSTRDKLSKASKNVPKKLCPHCTRGFQPNMYERFHGENCKMNKKVLDPCNEIA